MTTHSRKFGSAVARGPTCRPQHILWVAPSVEQCLAMYINHWPVCQIITRLTEVEQSPSWRWRLNVRCSLCWWLWPLDQTLQPRRLTTAPTPLTIHTESDTVITENTQVRPYLKARSHRPNGRIKYGSRTIPDFCASFTWFRGVVRGWAWRAIWARITYWSRKNGVNFVRNTLIRIRNTSICTRSRVLNRSKPAIAFNSRKSRELYAIHS